MYILIYIYNIYYYYKVQSTDIITTVDSQKDRVLIYFLLSL